MLEHVAVPTATSPAILTTGAIRSIGPYHLVDAIVIAIDAHDRPTNRDGPGVTSRETYREIAVAAAGECATISTRDKDGHMLDTSQLLDAAINRSNIIRRHVTFSRAQTDADDAARVGIIDVIIKDTLQHVIDVRPDVVIGAAIRLVQLNVYRARQTRDHLDIQRRFAQGILWRTINVDHGEIAFEVDTVKVVLNVTLVRTIDFDQIDRHILTIQAAIP